MKKMLYLVSLISILAQSACSKDNGTTNQPASPQPSMSGRVTDNNGNPIANVKIVIEHATWFGTYVFATAGNDGFYKVECPANPAGSWTAKAQIMKSCYGTDYKFDLDIDNPASFKAGENVVRNFKWKLSGAKASGGYYGAHLDVYQWGITVNMTDVKIKLTPVEEFLPDGSRAQVIERNIEDVAGTFMIKDIPVGKYKAAAFYPGKNLLLDNRHDNDQPAAEKIVVFGKNGYLGETEYNIEF